MPNAESSQSVLPRGNALTWSYVSEEIRKMQPTSFPTRPREPIPAVPNDSVGGERSDDLGPQKLVQYSVVAEAGWYPDPNGDSGLRFWDGSAWTEYTTEGSAPPPPPPPALALVGDIAESTGRPRARMIRSPQEAEEVAAEWLRWFGFEDAKATGAGADGGVDVRAKSMVAQVKMHMVPVGRPDLQRLHGVATTEGAVALFFSLTDYTREAKEWAEQVGMALFRFSPAGEAEPVNGYAKVLIERAENRAVAAAPAREPLTGFPIGCSDDMARRVLTPKREGLRRVDRLLGIRQGWLPCVSVTYHYNYLHFHGRKGQKQERLFAHANRMLELVSGSSIWIPAPLGDMVTVAPADLNVYESAVPERLVERVEEVWDHLGTLRQPAARERYRGRLDFYGVPNEALTLEVSIHGKFAVPFFAALIENPAGQRFAVAEGVTGRLHDGLSETFTHYAIELIEQLRAGRAVAAP